MNGAYKEQLGILPPPDNFTIGPEKYVQILFLPRGWSIQEASLFQNATENNDDYLQRHILQNKLGNYTQVWKVSYGFMHIASLAYAKPRVLPDI